MGKLFDIVKNEVQLSPDVLAIPIIKEIWDRDKNRSKDKAKKEISYIVFISDYRSPYKDVPNFEKESIIRRDIFGKSSKWEPDEVITEAVDKYKQLQKTRTMHLLDSARVAVEKLSEYFETVNFIDTDDYGKPKHSAKELASNLGTVGNIVKSLINLEKQVQSEIVEASARGGTEIGYYENPGSINSIKVK